MTGIFEVTGSQTPPIPPASRGEPEVSPHFMVGQRGVAHGGTKGGSLIGEVKRRQSCLLRVLAQQRVAFLCIFVVCRAMAQSVQPGINEYAMKGYCHEDLSDILRLFPGMYPRDLGTLGAPLYFSPWGLWPGQMRYTLDGLPLERRFDGLWDPGFLPVSEVDSIAFHALPVGGLFPGAGGRLDITTRDMPVDSPYSEIRLREGFYDYGTVDFAHAQPIYRTLSFQLTGRLGWYTGMRERTGSRFIHLRAKLKLRPFRNWRLEGIGSRTKSHSDSELNYAGQTLSRTEGQLALRPDDSLSVKFRPQLRLFLREDRENWGEVWKARESSGGALLSMILLLPRQTVEATALAHISSLEFPTQEKASERGLEASVADSIDVVGILGIESGVGLQLERDWEEPAYRYGARAVLPFMKVCALFGGFQSVEDFPSPLWLNGGYALSDRPLLISPSVSNLDDSLVDSPREKERVSQVEAGISIERARTQVRISAVRIAVENQFSPWTSTSSPSPSADSRWGGAFEGRLLVRSDLSLETRWSLLWATENPLANPDEMRGFSRLYFERTFFRTPLFVRASLMHTYLGERTAFSHLGTHILEPVHLIGFRVSARIKGFEIFWGTENIGAKHYEYVPGFLMIRKEEYWGFNWSFWF